MSPTSPNVSSPLGRTAPRSVRRAAQLVCLPAAALGVGLASAGAWLDQSLLGLAGAAVAAVPSVWLSLRPDRHASVTQSFPPTRQWLGTDIDPGTWSLPDGEASPVSSARATPSTRRTARPAGSVPLADGPSVVHTVHSPFPGVMGAQPMRPAILPAPVRPALTSVLSAAPDSQGREAPETEGTGEPQHPVDLPAAAVQPVSARPTDDALGEGVRDPRPFTSPRPVVAGTVASGPAARASSSTRTAGVVEATTVDLRDKRVDTAELERIWQLDEAGAPTTGPMPGGRGRHAASAPVDSPPACAPRADSPRRRARSRG